MNILISGSAGFLAHSVIKRLIVSESVNSILGIDIKASNFEHSKYTHYQCDIRDDISSLCQSHSIDCIIHLASIVNPPPGMSEEEVESIEIDGVKNLASLVSEFNIKKFIFTSSGAAYGYYKENPKLIPESYRTKGNPEFPYSKHKVEAENILLKIKEDNQDLQLTILRPGTILGPGMRGPIIDYFNKSTLVGVKGFQSPFCFIYNDDIAECVKQTVESDSIEGIFNLSGDGSISMKELATQMNTKFIELPKKLMENAIRILRFFKLTQYSPYQVNFICYRPVLDNNKFKSTFKNLPTKSSQEVFNVYLDSRGA